MNDQQFNATTTYLRQLADLLCLKDWEVKLQREQPEHDDAWAEVDVCRQRRVLWIKVAWPEFFDSRTPEQRREYLAHELLHAFQNRPVDVVRDLVKQVDTDVARFAQEQFIVEMEFANDDLARIIAPHLPLPPTLPSGALE